MIWENDGEMTGEMMNENEMKINNKIMRNSINNMFCISL